MIGNQENIAVLEDIVKEHKGKYAQRSEKESDLSTLRRITGCKTPFSSSSIGKLLLHSQEKSLSKELNRLDNELSGIDNLAKLHISTLTGEILLGRMSCRIDIDLIPQFIYGYSIQVSSGLVNVTYSSEAIFAKICDKSIPSFLVSPDAPPFLNLALATTISVERVIDAAGIGSLYAIWEPYLTDEYQWIELPTDFTNQVTWTTNPDKTFTFNDTQTSSPVKTDLYVRIEHES